VLGTDGVLRALDANTGSSRWTASADVPGNFDSPSVANGVVYTAGFHGVVQAFDAYTGAQLFETTLSQFFGGNAVIAGGALYAATENSGLYALGVP
jgi:outer membrane protein assembly factor BamB